MSDLQKSWSLTRDGIGKVVEAIEHFARTIGRELSEKPDCLLSYSTLPSHVLGQAVNWRGSSEHAERLEMVRGILQYHGHKADADEMMARWKNLAHKLRSWEPRARSYWEWYGYDKSMNQREGCSATAI